MNALMASSIGAEIAVIASLAVSSFHIAFAGPDADMLAAAPLVTVVALESMRLPLAFRLPRMRFLGMAVGVLMLSGLSVITGEAASIAYSNLIDQRTRSVAEAERDLTRAEIDHDALGQAAARRAEEISRLTAEVETARKHRTEIDRPTELQPVPGGRTCAGKRGSWNCGAAVQTEAVRANAEAQRAHSDELRDASVLVRDAETRLSAVPPGPDMRASDAKVAEAKRAVAEARASNPMFRVAAAWQRTPVEALTSEEFEVVKHWAVIALASATALATALAAMISALPDRASAPSKLARRLRAIARRRRPIIVRRDVPGPIRFRDRVVYLPTDPATGRVLP